MLIQCDTSSDTLAELRAAAVLLSTVIAARGAPVNESFPGMIVPDNTPVVSSSAPEAGATVLPFPSVTPVAPTVDVAAPNLTSTATTPAADERDSANLPWDQRIHSETRAKNKDGTWRFRRNLDPALRDTVMAELRAAHSPVAVAAPVPQLPFGDAPLNVPAGTPPYAGSSDPAAAAIAFSASPAASVPLPPASAVQVPPAPPAGVPDVPQPPVLPTGLTAKELVPRMNRALAAGTLTQPKILEACKGLGIEGIAQIMSPANQPKLDQLAQLLGVCRKSVDGGVKQSRMAPSVNGRAT